MLGADGENQQENQGLRAQGHCDGRREGRECTKTLKHGVPIRRVAQAAPRASTGLTWTHGPFRMRNLLSHKDEWHSWVITHTKKTLLSPA